MLLISSEKFKSDSISQNMALMAPLVLILVLGSALSSYSVKGTISSDSVKQFLAHRSLHLFLLRILVEFVLLIRLLTSCLSHRAFLSTTDFDKSSSYFWHSRNTSTDRRECVVEPTQ